MSVTKNSSKRPALASSRYLPVLFLCAILITLASLAVASAQTGPATCDVLPADVIFKPSNCLPAGGTATLETARFRGVGIVSVLITGPNGRVGDRDHGVRLDGDGMLRLPIDTTSFYGVQIPEGDYTVVVKDITGQVGPIIAPMTIGMAGASPSAVPTAPATTTPVPGSPTPSVTPATPSPSPTTSGTAGGTPAATRTPATATRTPGATPSPTTPSDAATLCRRNPNPEDAPNDPIQITDADFNMQNPNATLLNIGDSEVNLTGWTLCSITSDRAYALVLSIASQDERTLSLNNAGETSDAEPDDAALYDPDGTLIAYFEE